MTAHFDLAFVGGRKLAGNDHGNVYGVVGRHDKSCGRK